MIGKQKKSIGMSGRQEHDQERVLVSASYKMPASQMCLSSVCARLQNVWREANSLVAVGANSRRFVVFCAVNIRIVAESSITLSNGSPSSLVLEMPVETSEWSVARALVLQK